MPCGLRYKASPPMETLLTIDRELFLLLNGLHAAWLDPIMAFCSGKITWIPLYLLLLYAVWRRLSWKGLLVFLLAAGLMVLLADQGSVLIKNLVQRPRPCHAPELAGLVHLPNGRCGGAYGFVSSHASNVFALALLASLVVRNSLWTCGLFLWAVLVSYSRIYMGVHYPGDVLCGALLGLVAGTIAWAIFRLLRRRLLPCRCACGGRKC